MEVISHVCDVCKQSKTKDDMVQLELSQRDRYSNKLQMIKSNIKLDICQDCLKKKGITIEKSENEEDESGRLVHNEVTFRDKFIDLLVDCDVQFYE